MKIFVTGGTGFIGSWTVDRFLKDGHDVTVLARNPRKVAGFIERERVTFVAGDMSEHDRFESWLAGHDAVVHHALSWGDTAVEMLLKDTLNSVALLQAAGESGVRHFHYTSSTAAFGDYRHDMEETMLADPIDWYGATKSATEKYAIAASYRYPMRVAIVRPGYTFGWPVVEGGPTGPDGFDKIVAAARSGETIRFREGDGTQFMFAGDLAELYSQLLASERNREIYHAVGVPQVEWAEVARWACELCGSSSDIMIEPNRSAGRPRTFTMRKVRDHFGLEFHPIPEIKRYLAWLLAQ